MFGSKLRSWMENHIVRPRKKTNKNKNSHGNAAAGALVTNATVASVAHSSHDALKKNSAPGFSIYHGNGTMSTTATTVTTETTTTSVSISQTDSNNSHSHFNNAGSSSSVVVSPARRRDVSPIQSHSRRYGWQTPERDNSITSAKTDNVLYTPQQSRLKSAYSAQMSQKESVKESEHKNHSQNLHQPQPNYSSSSISSLSWSTGSKEPSLSYNTSSQNNNNVCQVSEDCTDAVNGIMHDLPEDDPNAVHYEEIRTLLRHPAQHEVELERPKSEQLSRSYGSAVQRTAYLYEEPSSIKDDVHPRYGRLLPSKIQPQTACSIDNLNSHDVRLNSVEYLANQQNNNYTQYTQRVANIPHQNSMVMCTQRSRLRNNRYANALNGNLAGSGTTVPNIGLLHTLSSPESAYSTGYSTDGTSPGAIYTPPEYYINMRTGTHYFPKSINSLAIEAQRYKFGLNKIEEMSPIDPLPKSNFPIVNGNMENNQTFRSSDNGNSLRNSIILPTLQGFESPSPRQRCRIRTNPWYSTTDTSSSGTTVGTTNKQQFHITTNNKSSTVSSTQSCKSSMSVMRMELDAGSTSSSGIKSSNEAEDISPDKNSTSSMNHHNGNASYESSESSSSLTEVENMQRTYSPNTIRRKRVQSAANATTGVIGIIQQHASYASYASLQDNVKELPVASKLKSPLSLRSEGKSRGALAYPDNIFVSDDDATLNEMMGKFDESYIYEKETDILSSDSDPTDCLSELDTGQDAEDECDTDELLDIDFIDTVSVQEVNDCKNSLGNLGSCHYFNYASPRGRRNSQRAHTEVVKCEADNQRSRTVSSSSAQRRKKRFHKTRKKSQENKDNINNNISIKKFRETRSVGGTPVSLRKYPNTKERNYKTSPLSNRSSSMVLAEGEKGRRFLTIADSEKALLKADMDADVKYRELILEAESLIASMRNSVQSIPRETPLASPRRINPLVNRRIEHLKNSELEPKKDPSIRKRSLDASTHAEQELVAAINKRIELLKHETVSVPNSPKLKSRLSPRKTHVTNFINQNLFNDIPRKTNTNSISSIPTSPQLQLNGRRLISPGASPKMTRRNRSQSPRLLRANMQESDSETETTRTQSPSRFNSLTEDITNQNYLPDVTTLQLNEQTPPNNNRTFLKPTFLHFKSVGGFHCPQSEPLKRKVYKGSPTYERIQHNFDFESEIPRQMLLDKIHSIRQRSQASHEEMQFAATLKSSSHKELEHIDDITNLNSCQKQQLILDTIANLKRSLENQSVELNGLNED